MGETLRVMLVEPDCCVIKSETQRCRECGLTGAQLVELRSHIPATIGYLINLFPEWTEKGAVFQSPPIDSGNRF